MSEKKSLLPEPKAHAKKRMELEQQVKQVQEEKKNKVLEPIQKRRANLRVLLHRAKKAGNETRAAEIQKQLDELKGLAAVPAATKGVIKQETIASLPPELTANKDVIFAPNSGPQTAFLAASEREVLYGGAAGGGKSIALLMNALRYCDIPEHRAIIFRRTNEELRELKWKAREIYPRAFPGAKWAEQHSTWTFPSGATVWFTYLDRDDDVTRYQGQSFTQIGWDELTQWPTPFAYEYMRSRLRGTNPRIPLEIRATTNPGGPGSWWVKKMFVDPAPWGTAFPALDISTGKPLLWDDLSANIAGRPEIAGTPLFYRRFIPAKLTDNPFLMQSTDYLANLMSLPEVQRKQLLEGNWEAFEDSAFPEFDKFVHVIEPFKIPNNWPKFRGADWGYKSPACCLWFAVDHDQTLYVYRELYVTGYTADKFAQKVLELEAEETIRYGVLDASAWASRGEVGPSVAETMIRAGCRWRPSDRSPKSRTNGKLEVHRRLRLDDITAQPTLKIFNTCHNLVRTLPMLPSDKNNPEDVDTDAEDHAYDALRYGVTSRPLNNGLQWDNSNPTYRPVFNPADSTFGY